MRGGRGAGCLFVGWSLHTCLNCVKTLKQEDARGMRLNSPPSAARRAHPITASLSHLVQVWHRPAAVLDLHRPHPREPAVRVDPREGAAAVAQHQQPPVDGCAPAVAERRLEGAGGGEVLGGIDEPRRALPARGGGAGGGCVKVSVGRPVCAGSIALSKQLHSSCVRKLQNTPLNPSAPLRPRFLPGLTR
jgi:hypothetical protein